MTTDDPPKKGRNTYMIELLARDPLVISQKAFVKALGRRLGVIGDPRKDGDAYMFPLRDHRAPFGRGTMPIHVVLMPSEDFEPNIYSAIVPQSRTFPEAGDALSVCRHACVLTAMSIATLPQAARRHIIAQSLLAALECMKVDALFWRETWQLVDPKLAVQAFSLPKEKIDWTFGFFNIRFYNISDGDGHFIMDTLGLNAFGLTDLQIRYRELKPNRVGALLYNLGAYILEKGDVLQDGHLVPGLEPDERWLCRRQASLFSPDRDVLDIDPGPPFAVGP